MANAAVPRTRQEDAFERSEEPEREAPAGVGLLRQSRILVLLWGLFALGVAGWLLFGMVRVGAGAWSGRRMRITQIWSRFVAFLGDQGASPVVISLVALAVTVALIGGIWLVWVGMRLPDAPPPVAHEEPPGS